MSRPLIRHGWSKRSGRIAAVPVLAGPHDTTNTSGYDFRKGQGATVGPDWQPCY